MLKENSYESNENGFEQFKADMIKEADNIQMKADPILMKCTSILAVGSLIKDMLEQGIVKDKYKFEHEVLIDMLADFASNFYSLIFLKKYVKKQEKQNV